MPIFEYVCQDCKKPFEALVMGSGAAECPHCQSPRLQQQISVFQVGAARAGAPAPVSEGGGCGAPSCCMGNGGCAED